jgi:hypothetical protein
VRSLGTTTLLIACRTRRAVSTRDWSHYAP